MPAAVREPAELGATPVSSIISGAGQPASSVRPSRVARVVAEHRDRYLVALDGAARPAVLAGRLRRLAERDLELRPAVGDWVEVAEPSPGADGPLVVGGVRPRRSAIRRKSAGDAAVAQVVAANVDVALVLTAVPGDLSARRLERYLTLVWESGALPVVVLTKADLADDLDAALADARRAAPGADVVALSAATGAGVAQLDRWLARGVTAVLLGSSGVGKSTLANRLAGAERLRTGAVRGDGRGRHTTTHRELIELPGGASLVDTPGLREVQLWAEAGEDAAGLAAAFADVAALAAGCRFADCAHEAEPGCAVRAAVADGRLDGRRLDAWHALRRELAWLEQRRDARAAAERRAGERSAARALRAVVRRKRG